MKKYCTFFREPKKDLSFITENTDSSKEEEMIKFMDVLLEGVHLQLGSKRYPYYLFFIKDNENIMYQDTENGYLWVSFYKIWRFLESDFKLNYGDIQEFMRRYVALRYNLRGVTPKWLFRKYNCWLHLDTI